MVLEAYTPSLDVLVGDLLRSLPLAAWVLAVVHVVSRLAYQWALPRWGDGVARYIARKVIHMAAGGVVALLTPFVFREPLVPALLGVLLAVYVYLPHRAGRLMDWFQDPGNISEVYYCLAWSVAILAAWPFDVWAAVYPLFLMSFGDGVTGIIRGVRQRRRVKSWDGSLGFFAVSAPVGYLLYGLLGVAVAAVATLLERWERVDDNISVPLVSVAMLLAARAAGV
ncbi:MAG: dolichol kinase [Crenarchaeota archaeon]|nr:dolichol kinase [Thermoproteota archaeon]